MRDSERGAGETGTRARPRGERLLLAASWLSLVVVVAAWGAKRYVGERHWLGVLLAFMPQQPFLVLPALLGSVSVLRRCGTALAVNAAALAWTCWVLMGVRVPLLNGRSAGAPTIRVLTYNTHCATGGVDNVARIIRDTGPDVVCLQEVAGIGNSPDPAPALAAALSGYEVKRTSRGGMTLSRCPIVKNRVVPLGSPTVARQALMTAIDVRGQRVTVVNVHLMTSDIGALHAESVSSLSHGLRRASAVRTQQVAALLRLCEGVAGPLVAAGDFNTPPGTKVHRLMSAQLRDAFMQAGHGFGLTFTSARPLLRIDYVWASSQLRVQSCRALDTQVSDHRPVLAELALQSGAR